MFKKIVYHDLTKLLIILVTGDAIVVFPDCQFFASCGINILIFIHFLHVLTLMYGLAGCAGVFGTEVAVLCSTQARQKTDKVRKNFLLTKVLILCLEFLLANLALELFPTNTRIYIALIICNYILSVMIVLEIDKTMLLQKYADRIYAENPPNK